MIERKHVFQLVSKKDGSRSEVVCLSRRQFAEELSQVGDDVKDGFYVLVLADVTDEQLPLFSESPMLTVRSFVSLFNFSEAVQNG